MSSCLDDPIDIGRMRVPNRLYRAPLLECAGTDEDTVETLINELEPAAASGTGLVFQGATVVSESGGAVAPNMTRVHDREFVQTLQGLTDTIHAHDARIVLQLDHGGLRTLETWHEGYHSANTDLKQLAVSKPPLALRAAEQLGFLSYNPHVLSTEEVYDLAADFGRAAAYAVETGYDGIHLAGANMGVIQQFLSPYYNRRDDEFAARTRFLELVYDEIRERAGDVPLMTKVPAETVAPPFVRRGLSRSDGVRIAERLATIGYDALVPVEVSTFWDMSLVRGEYPERAWDTEQFQSGYAEAFGSEYRAAVIDFMTRVQAKWHEFELGWNEQFCRAVRERVSVPVLCEGGIRERSQMDRLLEQDACDLVGVGRPFYAEPRLAARLLDDEDATVVCENCNNCTVPQATGAPGMCRTPAILQQRGELEQDGAYDRNDRAVSDNHDERNSRTENP
jgi:2,4-dienoyl-CoA reductase-like NADH-dependent reductase (Old Yellow Enzyme family)